MVAAKARDRLQGSVAYLEAHRLNDQWRQSQRVPDDKSLQTAFQLAREATHYDPSNAEYRLLLADLRAWRVKSLRLWPNLATTEMELIVDRLKTVLAARPTWFEAWIRLVLVKFQLGQIDQEMIVAMEKSMETVRYETSVHHGVAFVGLRVWDELGPDLKKQIQKTLTIALGNRYIRKFVVKEIVTTRKIKIFKEKLESDTYLEKKVKQFLQELKGSESV